MAELVANFSLQLYFPGGESFEEFIERASKFLDRLRGYKPSQTILIVSHGGPLRVLICRLLEIDLNHWRQFRIDNASLSIMKMHPQGAIMDLFNDTSHLKDKA